MSNTKILNVQTITPRYDEVEDRIRVSINHEDKNNRIDFLITRKFILKLLPIYEEYIIKAYYSDKSHTAKIPDNLFYTLLEPNTNTRITSHSQLKTYQKIQSFYSKFIFLLSNKINSPSLYVKLLQPKL